MSMKIALAGNPNSGKTTLFNALTGSNQYVGNWPGVTVEKKEGAMKGFSDVTLVDLPGIYSLSPYTLEEVVSRNYLLKEKPHAILNIVDATYLERNIYYTTQFGVLGIPVVIALNMMDVVEKTGDTIDTKAIEQALGCPVVRISALRGTGMEQAAKAAVSAAANHSFFHCHRISGDLDACLSAIEEKLPVEIPESRRRFYAVKLFERDERLADLFETIPDVSGEISAMEEKLDDDSESIMANARYLFITELMKACIHHSNNPGKTPSERIDSLLTNRFLALPIFALIMFVVYYISVTTVGTWATDWTNDGLFGEGFTLFGNFIPGIPVLVEAGLTALETAPWLNSLILDGILGGVGAVLGFVPQILVLFLFLAFLEGCGYMARIAFIMDRIFRKFGLSGKSFIPILIGTGCSVPGIMASRTIENDRDRKVTVITTSFMPCSAKLPIIALIAGAMFQNAWWVAPSAYFVGIGAIMLSGLMLKKLTLFRGDESPFVMELPAYHMPTLGNILSGTWERGWSFIKKAGTVILLSTVVLWFMQNFGFEQGGFGMVTDLNNSVLTRLGNLIAWLFAPLGWGDWRAAVATVTGLIAKENVVGTFGILFGSAEVAEDGAEIWAALRAAYSPLSAYSFLVFNLLCAPCFAAIGAIKREMNSAKWTAFAILYQTGFAYFVSLCIYQIGSFIGGQGSPLGLVIAVALMAAFFYLAFRPRKRQEGILCQR